MKRILAGLFAVGLAAMLLTDDALAQGRKSNVTMPPPELRRSQGNLRPPAPPELPDEVARPEEPEGRERRGEGAERRRGESRRYYAYPYSGRSYYRPYYGSRSYYYDYYRPPVYGPGPVIIGPRITPYPYIINPLGQGYRPQYYVPYYRPYPVPYYRY